MELGRETNRIVKWVSDWEEKWGREWDWEQVGEEWEWDLKQVKESKHNREQLGFRFWNENCNGNKTRIHLYET